MADLLRGINAQPAPEPVGDEAPWKPIMYPVRSPAKTDSSGWGDIWVMTCCRTAAAAVALA